MNSLCSLLLISALLFGRQSPSPMPNTIPQAAPQHLWLEAEWFGPLSGANFSFMDETRQTRGSWAIAGPDAAPAWTQGGESEFMSIAARADEPGQLVVGRDMEVPLAGTYTLWVRYADYRQKQEAFGVRIQQSRVITREFGLKPVIDELDPMKLLWGWSYGWDSATVPLEKGHARVELYTTGPTQARRCIDCLCFTTDTSYHPYGREKPDFAAWKPLRQWRQAGQPDVEPLVQTSRKSKNSDVPASWKIADAPPAFLWNIGTPWLEELKKAPAERVESPFGVDTPLLKDFLTAFKGKSPPVYSDALSGPVAHIPLYPDVFRPNSPFVNWLTRHPQQKFAILLNYGEPTFSKEMTEPERKAIYTQFQTFRKQFVGFIAGENLAYAAVDTEALNARIRAAHSRSDVLDALREFNSAATRRKFATYWGIPLSEAEAWGPVISCLSANNEAYAHAVCAWGARQVGHENTGNSPTLARRLAFLRGACRQFGARLVDYQSANLGDSATMFSRELYFYPASSRYILDNSYDAWAGAGTQWLLKDYLLWHLAGCSAFYNEQGVDIFWKPGGNSAGDGFPVQLSPKGQVAEAALRLAQKVPRGAQVTPVAFLADAAHGYSQERFEPGAFGLDPKLNPAVLSTGRHEASLRGWFDLAYYPAPETQNEPATAIRQTYVNGVFGDIFDVIVTAPGHTGITATYPVVIAAGEVSLSQEWGKALRAHVEKGGTLVVCADQCSGPGVASLGLPAFGPEQEAASFRWNLTGETVTSNIFRYRAPATTPAQSGVTAANPQRVLATGPNGSPLAVAYRHGQGQIIVVGVPLGLGIDARPVPLLGLLLKHLTQNLLPIKVTGDVEWTLNRLEDGRWLVGLFNNRGITKPEHGILPTDHSQSVRVTLRAFFPVAESREWLTETDVEWQPTRPVFSEENTLTLTLPAGANRFLAVTPERR